MTRIRTALGLVAGAMLVIFSAMHALMGWPALRTQIAATTAPADLIANLGLGWNFGAAAMLALGIIVLHVFIGRLRGVARSTFAPLVIGAVYLAFGIFAYAVARNPFFIGVFILPGVLLLVASMGSEQPAAIRKPEDRF